jgi:hypothetical protein
MPVPLLEPEVYDLVVHSIWSQPYGDFNGT